MTTEPKYLLPTLPQDELLKRAVKDCERYIKSLTDKKFLIEPKRSEQSWDEDVLRAIFDVDLLLWRRWKKMDIFVDELDRPVGFIDHGKLAPCEWKPMTHAEVVELAAATGYTPADARILSMAPGPGGVIEARLATQPTRVDSPRYTVRINPLRRAVIAIHPEEAAGAEA